MAMLMTLTLFVFHFRFRSQSRRIHVRYPTQIQRFLSFPSSLFFLFSFSYEVGMDVSGDVGVCYQSIDTDELRVVSHEEPRKSSPFLLVD